MSAFIVELDNQPGELARLCEAMASSGVNLLLCATTHADSGVVAFIAGDEASAQAVLDSAGDRVSAAARAHDQDGKPAWHWCGGFRKLADAGVNVDRFWPVRISDDLFCAAICADDAAAAEGTLARQVVTE